MYEEFYGLTERPFLTVPDPEFLYWSDNHLMAFTMLRYGIMTRAPITVVTGEIGAGKTTLLRHLLRELPEDLTVGLISNMQDGRGEVLHWAMMALDQSFDDEPYVKLFKRFQDHLIDCYAAGRRVLLIVDEAQELSTKSLEELRMFSNINSDKDELLQLILVGQPQLRDTLSKPELTQFSQRISSDFHLGPLNAEEVAQYIHHRLAVAGATWKIFSDRTCELVHEATGGVPRLVNILCQLCMVYGFSYERKVIDEDLLRQFLDGAKRHGIYRHFSAVDTGPKLVRTQA